jgi:hypothetical protein
MLAHEIMSLCRYFRIRNVADSLYMTEVGIAGGRVDLMVIDLRTHEVIGYEVKVTRQDFLSDRKWSSYTPYFNRFYFATLPGVILPGELPPEIGHVEMRGSGDAGDARRLVQVQKGPRLQPVFTRKNLGEAHLVNLLLGYMRDFNWRQQRKLRVTCPKCRTQTDAEDPRGIPFGKWKIPEHVEPTPTPLEAELARQVNDAILGKRSAP